MNYMKQVAEMLGVELNETFKTECGTYKFTDEKLENITPSVYYPDFVLYKLLIGQLEIAKTILDNKEKEYLENVIRPFKDKVVCIRRINARNKEWIAIYLDYDSISLPYFEEETMYKGMKVGKDYTLKELGLFEDE